MATINVINNSHIKLQNGIILDAEIFTTNRGEYNVREVMTGEIKSNLGDIKREEKDNDFSYDKDDFLEVYMYSRWEKFLELIHGGGSFYADVKFKVKLFDVETNELIAVLDDDDYEW
jgi:hypothetical protein